MCRCGPLTWMNWATLPLRGGAATLDIQTEGGETVQAEAKFVVVWKRQADGSWKWDTDCFNFDAPLG